MVIPNKKRVYGSDSTMVSATGTSFDTYCHKNDMYSQVIYITKTLMKDLDQPSQRCSQQNLKMTTSTCIAKFLENTLGCNPMVLGSQFLKTPTCTTKTQLLALANASKLFEGADENDVYEMTGCLPSCIKDHYSLTVAPLKSEFSYVLRCQVHLEFKMLYSSYKEEEQYIIYDVASFIADVGGYMGLLLGSSLLSLYMAMEAWMRKLLRQRPFKGKITV